MTAPGKPDPLAALRERFRAATGNTIDAFRQLSAKLAQNPTAPEVIETLRRELHRVHGTAGSYGYAEASRLAGQLEQRAIRWERETAFETAQRSTIIAHFATALELAFRKADEPEAQPGATPRTMLAIGVGADVARELRTEGELRGYRISQIEPAQLQVSLVRDIAPHILVAPIRLAAEGVAMSRAAGLPLLLLEDRPRVEREPAPSAPGVSVADLTLGIATVFDLADRFVTRTGWTGATVLAVDDDPSVLAMVRYVLEGPELRVVTLDDPARIRDELLAVEPSLLLIDVMMPQANGIEVARAIRRDARWRDLPVVMLSAEIDATSRGAAHEAGADEFIPKPIVPSELRARVAARLERFRLSRLEQGLHPVTGLTMTARTLREAESALRDDRARSLALVRPSTQDVGAGDTTWLRESLRIVRALAAPPGVAGYDDSGALLLVTNEPSAALFSRLMDLGRGAGESAAGWAAGVVSLGELPARDLSHARAAASEAADQAPPVVGHGAVRVAQWHPGASAVAPDVIVVEDDPALSEMLQYALRASGFTFRAFDNGRLALDALLAMKTRDRRPFVLLDVDLPGMDGYSVHERLRIERPGEFAVVYITVHAAESDQLRALRSGAVDFITKPLNLRLLLAKMSSWVQAMGQTG